MSSDSLKLPVQFSGDSILPVRASQNSAGLDLRADEDLLLAPGACCLLATGLSLAIPEGYEVQIRPRSGLSLKSRLRLANSPGTIDADYRDELRILLWNAFSQAELPQLIAAGSPLLKRFGAIAGELSLRDYLCRRGLPAEYPASLLQQTLYLNSDGDLYGSEKIVRGDRVAQMLLLPYPDFQFERTENVRLIGQDRGGGFGHSGKR